MKPNGKSQLIRRFLPALPAMLAVMSCPAWAAEKQPNIILTIVDDMSWCAPSCYGHPFSNTPNIDKLASDGVRFTRFYASFPQCTPTRASVLTGRNPGRSYCIGANSTMPVEERTLAEILKDKGYYTAHIGKWHLGGMMYGDKGVQDWYRHAYARLPKEKWPNPLNQGFEYSYSIGDMMDNYRKSWLGKPNTGPVGPVDLGGWMLQENGRPVARDGKPAFTEGDTSMLFVDKALEVIRRSKKEGKPFFICLWFTSSHGPYVAMPEYEAPYKDKSKQPGYWGEIKGIDVAMGKLREELKSLGLFENTMNWFFADNGNFDFDGENGGLSGGKGTIYEGGIRVPLIVEYPAGLKPRVTDTPTGTVDITPTVCGLLKIPMPNDREYDGINILPQLEGKPFKRDKPLFFAFRQTDGGAYMLGMIDGNWKLIWGLDSLEKRQPGKYIDAASPTQLFNLAGDPGEKRNLANNEDQSARIAGMKKTMTDWNQSVLKDFQTHANRGEIQY